MTDARGKLDCPQCHGHTSWRGGHPAGPDRVASLYTCPNPECPIGLIEVTTDE